MVGKYRIVVRDSKATYDFVIKRKYTLIIGDSSTGKTKLYNMLDSKSAEVQVIGIDGTHTNNVGIAALPRNSDVYETSLMSAKPMIYVVDESVSGINTKRFINLLRDSNAYFILMSRKLFSFREDGRDLNALPLSINEIYEIEGKNINGVYYQNRLVNKYCFSSYVGDNITYLITEDSGSGFELYSRCYNTAKAFSSHGNG